MRFKSFVSRLQHLGLVLFVSLAMPITGSFYYLAGAAARTSSVEQEYSLWGLLVTESSSLAVLWYVMNRQGKTWKSIGWSFSRADLPRAVGLFLISTIASWAVYFPVQYIYHANSGRFLAQKSLNSVLGFGITTLSVLFVCLNPIFEELVVRAYTISELIDLGASRTVAVVISVALQVSYHLYQGAANVLLLASIFAVFSIYYARTRRIVPVILVHLTLDALTILR
jgi:membrane protease YdiL (CAAX protease family)